MNKYFPQSFIAGTSIDKDITIPEYSADEYSLVFYLINSSAKVTITATANGSDFTIYVPASTTSAYTAGVYQVVGIVSDGTDKFEVENGWTEIKLNPITATATDTRTHARKVLDAINELIESRMTTSAKVISADAKSFEYLSPDELIKMKTKYEALVKNEAYIAQYGDDDTGIIYTKFI